MDEGGYKIRNQGAIHFLTFAVEKPEHYPYSKGGFFHIKKVVIEQPLFFLTVVLDLKRSNFTVLSFKMIFDNCRASWKSP